MTVIGYTTDAKADDFTRHLMEGEQTLCGLPAGDVEGLALPVNCNECRVTLGRRNREGK